MTAQDLLVPEEGCRFGFTGGKHCSLLYRTNSQYRFVLQTANLAIEYDTLGGIIKRQIMPYETPSHASARTPENTKKPSRRLRNRNHQGSRLAGGT
jgi:hypothetical protein